jgi:hypothetical protein
MGIAASEAHGLSAVQEAAQLEAQARAMTRTILVEDLNPEEAYEILGDMKIDLGLPEESCGTLSRNTAHFQDADTDGDMSAADCAARAQQLLSNAAHATDVAYTLLDATQAQTSHIRYCDRTP